MRNKVRVIMYILTYVTYWKSIWI